MWYKGYDGEAQVWDMVGEDIVYLHSDAWSCWDPISFILPCISLLADKVLQDLQNTPFLDFCPNSLIFSALLILWGAVGDAVHHLHYWLFLLLLFRPVMLFNFLHIPPDTGMAYSFIIFHCLLKCYHVKKPFSHDAIVLLSSLPCIHCLFLCIISI